MASVEECASQSAFDQALQRAGTSQLVVVDFTASWCGPCQMIKPHFESLARQYTNVKFLKVDVDANQATARAYGVSAMPTFVFIKNKSVVETVRGADKNKLTAAVQKHSAESTSNSSFAGKGNTLSGGSNPFPRRHNPLGGDDEDDDFAPASADSRPHSSSRSVSDREEGEEREGDLDPELRAFLESQQASREQDDAETIRLREERIKAGGMRNVKSRYQREKEESMRKKDEREREAEKAYQEFVKAMGGSGASTGQSSRAGNKPMGFVSAGGASYNPARQQQPSASSSSPSSAGVIPTGPKSMMKASVTGGGGIGAMFGDAGEDDEFDDPRAKKDQQQQQPGKRKRAMDDFLGELQKGQAQRDQRYKDRIAEGKSVSSILALEGQYTGSRDVSNDPQTTNVCVLNLPANISEKTLGEFFAQWGDIGTVKIMWPRGDEISAAGGAGGGITALRNTKSAGLTGFVCFMDRRGAESAMKEADAISWGGSILRTSWGKAMPKPARAFYFMPPSSRRDKDARRRDGSSPTHHHSTRGRSVSPRLRESRFGRTRRQDRSPSPRSQILATLSDEQKQLIRSVAERVKDYGPSFEQMVRDKEAGNGRFEFLTSQDSHGSHYFKMILDDRYVPELPPKEFDDEGNASLYSSDSGEESESDRLKKQRKTETLGRLSRKRFESMLRSLTLRRERIARCSTFAIEHANASDTIADILTQSLLLPRTPIPRKLARLYVISDVLHNSAAPLPNAWKYRSAFESHGRLVVIFKHFSQIAMSFPGIMKQEGVKGHLRNVLDVWDDWMVFSPAMLEQLRVVVESGGRETDVLPPMAVQEQSSGEDVDGQDMAVDGEHTAANRAGPGPVDDDIDEDDIDGEDM